MTMMGEEAASGRDDVVDDGLAFVIRHFRDTSRGREETGARLTAFAVVDYRIAVWLMRQAGFRIKTPTCCRTPI